MENSITTSTVQQVLRPHPDLKSLDRLVGTWELSDDSSGKVRYEWMEDGFFLIQHFEINVFGNAVKGIEVIGHLRPFGQNPGKDIRSRAYDNSGNTFDYVYEIGNDTLYIWAGEKGSPAYYKGKFSKDGNTNSGEWVYPNGGYRSTMKRIQ
jgi:hypothetical protein